MARVTVEDCVLHVDNRFELVLVAAQRAKNIASGAALTIDRDGEKDPVIALREIAKETISVAGIREELVQNYQKRLDVDEIPDDDGTPSQEMISAADYAAEEMAGLMVDDFEEEDTIDAEDLDFKEENLDVQD